MSTKKVIYKPLLKNNNSSLRKIPKQKKKKLNHGELKREFKKTINEFRKRRKENKKSKQNKQTIDLEIDNNVKDDFTQSLHYLRSLNTEKKPSTSASVSTSTPVLKGGSNDSTSTKDASEDKDSSTKNVINIDKPSSSNGKIKIKSDPPYGILKNGKKPCYRNWSAKKHRNTDSGKVKPKNITIKNFTNATQDIIKPNIDVLNIPKVVGAPKILSGGKKKHRRKFRRKTIKRKLGKNINRMSIGVLIKNRKTRKLIHDAGEKLKKKPIDEIREDLLDRNLIKIGSEAPDYVLRKMYEDAVLSGDIHNKNSENLLHNYLSGIKTKQ